MMPRVAPFDRYAEAYDAWFTRNADLYEAELEAVRQLIPMAGEGMEVGVGSGKFAGPLGIRIGVEPSERMAARARRLGIDVHTGIAEDLPFPDESFDFVLMVTTICFVDDIARSFEEAFRVLRPGGRLIVGFVDRESELGRRYEAERESSRFYREATFYSTREVIGHLERAGFRIGRIKQTLLTGAPAPTIVDGFGLGSFVVLEGLKGSTDDRCHGPVSSPHDA